MTAGGSSLPEVQSILTSLARSRRCAEAGTAFGEGAAALARTAASVVTVEIDRDRAEAARSRLSELPNVELLEGDWQELLPLRAPFDLFFLDAGGIKQRPEEHLPQAVELLAPGGVLFLDDFTPVRAGDPAREALHAHPELDVAEHELRGAEMSVIVATRGGGEG